VTLADEAAFRLVMDVEEGLLDVEAIAGVLDAAAECRSNKPRHEPLIMWVAQPKSASEWHQFVAQEVGDDVLGFYYNHAQIR
jgi:hypothetical protein